jgi:hypothetical protein
MREFEQDYATQDQRSDGRYVLTRDLATYAITSSAISKFESYAAFDTIRSL